MYHKKKAKKIQEIKLKNNALQDNANATMSIFCLKNHHGMKDRVDVTTDDEKLTEVNVNFK